MLVGVISDSHDNIYKLDAVLEELKKEEVGAVIHLGDIISPFTVRRMKEKLGDIPVTGVLGNNDGDILLLSKLFVEYGWKLLNGPAIVELGGRRFLLMHGFNGLEHTEKLAETLMGFKGIDGVLYGHTHRALYKRVGDRILLNPGEICGYLTGKTSYAVLDTARLEARINWL